MSRKTKVELTNMCLIYDEKRYLFRRKPGRNMKVAWFSREGMWKRESL